MDSEWLGSSEDESDYDENTKKIDFSQQYRFTCHVSLYQNLCFYFCYQINFFFKHAVIYEIYSTKF